MVTTFLNMSFLSAPKALSFHVLILMLDLGFRNVKLATHISILFESVTLIKLSFVFTLIMGHHMGHSQSSSFTTSLHVALQSQSSHLTPIHPS